jgi:ABC-type polysaccharide transport system permease subunit
VVRFVRQLIVVLPFALNHGEEIMFEGLGKLIEDLAHHLMHPATKIVESYMAQFMAQHPTISMAADIAVWIVLLVIIIVAYRAWKRTRA